jgi:hypothetical protein
MWVIIAASIACALGCGVIVQRLLRSMTVSSFPPVVELATVNTARRVRRVRPVRKPTPLGGEVSPLGLTAGTLAGANVGGSAQVEPAPLPVYETGTSPYAVSAVQGALIRLPDDEADLPITFRPEGPDGRPLVRPGRR